MLDPERGYRGEKVEGLDFYVEHVSWKRLPKEVFEVYGGYSAAKEMRAAMGFKKNTAAATATATGADAEGKDTEGQSAEEQIDSHGGADSAVGVESIEVSESKQQDNDIVGSKKRSRAVEDGAVTYSLASRWFKADGYEDVGKAGITSIDDAKRRLQEEVYGSQRLIDEQIKRRRKEQALQILAPATSALFRKSVASISTRLPADLKAEHLLPSVSWQLRDQK